MPHCGRWGGHEAAGVHPTDGYSITMVGEAKIGAC
jgi:hypothetical protein